METIREIAEIHNLEAIETTSQRNAYPSRIKDAIIGFDSFEEAQEIADEYGLSIEVFEKKDGWSLWFRTGQTKDKEFEVDEGWFGDNYKVFRNDVNEEDFIAQEVTPLLENISDFSELQSLINSKKEIYHEIENADKNELIVTLDGCFYSVVEEKAMYFYSDTKHEVIGLIKRD